MRPFKGGFQLPSVEKETMLVWCCRTPNFGIPVCGIRNESLASERRGHLGADRQNYRERKQRQYFLFFLQKDIAAGASVAISPRTNETELFQEYHKMRLIYSGEPRLLAANCSVFAVLACILLMPLHNTAGRKRRQGNIFFQFG
ncbi:MAG: hypothetical protein IPP94_13630 [Ignavibacteria bacterium]|nr:hypothetical protein [Ignavibacteria bacterium]